MARTLGILKKTSLAGLAENWGEECFLLTTPVTYSQYIELKATRLTVGNDEAKAIAMMLDFIKTHVAGGKVKIYNGTDLEVVDVEQDDIDASSVEMINFVFASITGAQYSDPKASSTEVENSTTPVTPENTTEAS